MEQDVVSFQQMVTGLAGAFVPLLVQLTRVHLIPNLTKKNNYLLSLTITVLCTILAYFLTDKSPTISEFIGQAGVAFTISQMVYSQLEGQLKSTVGDVEADAGDEALPS